MTPKRLLFVCTGNSCRSVMAERLLRHLLSRAGVDSVHVESAGVFAMEGMQPTRETRLVLEASGIDCSDHRARTLNDDMIRAADLIFVMDRFHGEEVIRRVPTASGKVHLLKTYGLAPGEAMGDPSINDPIGKPMEVYEVCFSDIRDAVDRIVRLLGVTSV